MNALTTQGGAGFAPATAGEASSEGRALTSWEIDEVSGGNFLYGIGGLCLLGLICMDYGQEISDASVKLAEWIKGSD